MPSGIMDDVLLIGVSFTYLLFDACVLFYRFGGDGRRCFALRGVVLLNVSAGSGDGSPSLATTDAGGDGCEDYCAKQQRGQ